MSNIITTHDKDKFRGLWTPNTLYYKDDMVFNGSSLWVSLIDFTSDNVFEEANWFCPKCPNVGCVPPTKGWNICSATGPTINLEAEDLYLLSDDKKTAIYTDSVSGGQHSIRGVTPYNTSSSDKVYLELKIGYTGFTTQSGLIWGNNLYSFTDRFTYRGNNRFIYQRTGFSEVRIEPVGWPRLNRVGDIVRFFLRGTSLWVGYKRDGVEVEEGDPFNELSPVITDLPTNTDVLPTNILINSNDSYITMNSEVDEFEASPLGFGPWEV